MVLYTFLHYKLQIQTMCLKSKSITELALLTVLGIVEPFILKKKKMVDVNFNAYVVFV